MTESHLNPSAITLLYISPGPDTPGSRHIDTLTLCREGPESVKKLLLVARTDPPPPPARLHLRAASELTTSRAARRFPFQSRHISCHFSGVAISSDTLFPVETLAQNVAHETLYLPHTCFLVCKWERGAELLMTCHKWPHCIKNGLLSWNK